MTTGNATIREKLELLPAKPGVYLMLDGDGQVIYVGKAASLRNRVRSYFRGVKQPPKVQAMLHYVADFEYIVTDSEVEALILECNLIKEHRPKYNISLRDDKNYPYLKVTVTQDYPRLVVVRSVKKDGNRYFGPYTQVGALNETLKLLRQLFPLRTCSDNTLERTTRPCLNYHIARCLAPCQKNVSKEAYREIVKEVILFLEGKQEDLIHRLKEKMERAAAELKFEKAAEYRDQIRAIEQVLAKQKIIFAGQQSYDVIAFARGTNEACVQVFFIREGKLIGRRHFFLAGTDDLSRGEIMTAFLKQYYSQAETIPGEILLAEEPEEKELLEKWLAGLRGKKVSLKVPKKGEKHQLVEMVAENALTLLQEEEMLRRKKDMLTTEAVLELQQVLGLAKPPVRIEGFDISHMQGSMTVASMVVFENGEAKPQDYRRFRIKSVDGPDDYASMREVLTRRFRHLRDREASAPSSDKFAAVPDLILIDGGKGQLNVAVEVLEELGLGHLPVFGLAEKEELIFIKGNAEPIRLPRHSPALRLVQRVRDEAHRFALTYHRDLRSRALKTSVLDQIPGIGPKRKKALLRHFGSVARIKEASLEELKGVEGMTEKAALAIKEYL
ncbi:MAG TPA: excinuclease ABC subunit UvrC [Clostridia bacterium]|nr:excinuclease ABC subunit UvrC [Clostridia bacterium]